MNFLHEDGKGKLYNDIGEEVAVVEMEVDEESYPLDTVTDFKSYMDMKPPEKPLKLEKKEKEKSVDVANNDSKTRKVYRSYKLEDIESLTFLVDEKCMSIRSAAAQLKIPYSTARNWIIKNNNNEDVEIVGRKEGSGRPAGRPPTLTDEHKDYLVEILDEKPGLVLDEMMESLNSQFIDLSISKSALHKFITTKCNMSLKRAHFHSVERNCPEKIEERYQWVKHWLKTDMDYTSNCVFIDEAAFHINMKRTFAWSRKGERAVVKTPKTRARTTTILGAISSFGVVNIKVRRPVTTAPNKKRKTAQSTPKTVSRGTVTGHFYNFVATTIDVMDQYEEFKGHYLVMDNVSIHKNTDIKLYIESRGYGCIYLPPYSPELNPIEQFWSVCKSKLKRETLLAEETLTSRIRDASNKVLISDCHGFCRYSAARFQDCLDRKPL